MQHMAGLRSLSALQILFHHRDHCESMLREIRLCIIDNIVQCSALKVEYVAVCLAINGLAANFVAQLKRRAASTTRVGGDVAAESIFQLHRNSLDTPGPGPSSNPTWDIKGKGKAKSNCQGADMDIEHEEEPALNDKMPWTSDDSDEDGDFTESDTPIVNDGLAVSEIVGVKMWERETWGLSL
jgi:hypothetical protein